MQDIIKDYVKQSFRERKAHTLELIEQKPQDENERIMAAGESLDILVKFSRMLPKSCLEYWTGEIYPGNKISVAGLEAFADYLRGVDEETFDEKEITTVASGLFNQLVEGCFNMADKALLWKLMEKEEPEALLGNDIIFD